MSECIFCQIAAGKARSWKVFEAENAYAFLDINPVSRYHTLVIPKAHYRDIFDIPANDLQAVIAAVKHVADLYANRLGIRNVQIVNSSGAEAQQDVFHLHFHIVPRKYGDGQNIRWQAHPEWRGQFDQWLETLHES